MYGKRGSKYFEPPKGCVKFNEDSMQANMIEENLRKPAEVEQMTTEFEAKVQLESPALKLEAEDEQA